MPSIGTFDAGKRQRNASEAFSKRQPTSPQARASLGVGCFLVGGSQQALPSSGAFLAQMTKAEAEAVLSAMLRSINSGVAQTARAVYTFEQFTRDVYLPFCRRSWKESTAGTSEQIVKSHLVSELGKS